MRGKWKSKLTREAFPWDWSSWKRFRLFVLAQLRIRKCIGENDQKGCADLEPRTCRFADHQVDSRTSGHTLKIEKETALVMGTRSCMQFTKSVQEIGQFGAIYHRLSDCITEDTLHVIDATCRWHILFTEPKWCFTTWRKVITPPFPSAFTPAKLQTGFGRGPFGQSGKYRKIFLPGPGWVIGPSERIFHFPSRLDISQKSKTHLLIR